MYKKSISLVSALLLATSLALSGCGTDETVELSEAISEEVAETIVIDDVSDFVSGIEDLYVLIDSENMDYLATVTYDEAVVTEITVDDSDIDLSAIGEYSLTYSVAVDEEAYIEALEIEDVLMTEEGIQTLELTTNVYVIDEEMAITYTEDGLVVYTSDNEVFVAEDTEEEEDAEEIEESTEEETVATTDSSNSTSSSSSSTASTSKSSSSSSTSSSSKSSSSSSTSSSSKSSSSSSSSSSSKSTSTSSCSHNWVAVTETVYHEEVGHVEYTTIPSSAVCNGCGEVFYDGETDCGTQWSEHWHTLGLGHGSYTAHCSHLASEWVVDQEAYTETVVTGYTCSKCGATK